MVFIECDADEGLIRKLGIKRGMFQHAGDKFRVCKRLSQATRAIGLIDYDGGQSDPVYLAQCKLVEQRHKIQIYVHSKHENKLIVLQNTLEDWIIGVARNHSIDIGYANANEMHRMMPSRLREFSGIVQQLMDANCPEIRFLITHLLAQGGT